MSFEHSANIIAMIASFIAMVILLIGAGKIGGFIGKMIKILTAGIFMSVFCHAGFELMAVYGFINEEALFPVMGTLLTIGSLLFVWGGLIAINQFD